MAVVWIVVLVWPKTKIDSNPRSLKIGNKELSVYVADTPQEWSQGLSGLPSLAPDSGMLFIFNDSDSSYMWMKDMKFSLDFIWIDDDLKVVEYKENVSPSTYPQTFTSHKPVKYVLEVNAGWVAKNNIQIGDQVWYNR